MFASENGLIVVANALFRAGADGIAVDATRLDSATALMIALKNVELMRTNQTAVAMRL
jgi:hypothetical protein